MVNTTSGKRGPDLIQVGVQVGNVPKRDKGNFSLCVLYLVAFQD